MLRACAADSACSRLCLDTRNNKAGLVIIAAVELYSYGGIRSAAKAEPGTSSSATSTAIVAGVRFARGVNNNPSTRAAVGVAVASSPLHLFVGGPGSLEAQRGPGG